MNRPLWPWERRPVVPLTEEQAYNRWAMTQDLPVGYRTWRDAQFTRNNAAIRAGHMPGPR